jgi:hypothetical protein
VDAGHPEVVAKRKKQHAMKDDKHQQRLLLTTDNTMDAGEDELTQQAHIKTIQNQGKKSQKKQDKVAINVALDKTFAKRRVDVKQKSIADVKKMYPVLFSEEQVRVVCKINA